VLSERERQELEKIERHLAESDPRLAAALSQTSLVRKASFPRWRGWVALVLGWVSMTGAALAGWWMAALILMLPVLAITVAWIISD
jgi:hypothetical protein